MQGTIVSIDVREGELVRKGQQLFVMEAMKMEHVIRAHTSGMVRQIAVAERDAIFEGHPLAFIEEARSKRSRPPRPRRSTSTASAPISRRCYERHASGLDAARPEAVARRRKTHQRTARENVEDLCDPGTFVEYGALVLAAQRRRRALDDLMKNTPADGLVAGIGRVNGDLFDDSRAQCIAMSYDYTVLAGTQGQQNHRKKDRMFEIAAKLRLPVVFFTEGGGGRPGDTDGLWLSGLDVPAFHYWGKLSGLVPMVGINSGRCFAGNAALLGCCDVVIATANSNIGMGGPAMVEGGGLGVFRPEDIGPMSVQVRNGVVDLPVADEAEAVRVAKKYLSYFQGPVSRWECADQRLLRGIIPENRLRIYDVRAVIETLADTGSVLELRRHFGLGMVTALVRIEGRPLGVIANNPTHLAGAIDSDGADKAARFMQLCDAFDLPLLFLCDTPGIMVGPEIEKTALVRHAARMFVVGANISRAVLHYRAAQGLRSRRAGDGRGQLQDPDVHGLVADRRVRRDGTGGRGQAWLSQGIGGGQRTGRAQEAVRRDGGADVPAGQGAQQRLAFRTRRRDRSGRIAPLDSHGAALSAPTRATHRQKAPARRFLVNESAAALASTPRAQSGRISPAYLIC